MGLESTTYINGLVSTNPVGATDVVAAGDDHIRLIKTTLKNTFPNVTGAMSATQDNLNVLAGATISSSIGFAATVRVYGTLSTTLTLNPLVGNLASIVNGGGNIKIVPPTVDCTMVVQITNSASATATNVMSNFTKTSGDALTNTDGDDFMVYVTKVGTFSHATIVALQ
jgi:hypothetical protein